MNQAYTNPGKGTVLHNRRTTVQVADLLTERKEILSKDLNDLVGWQFSQAVEQLRRRFGWDIETRHLGGHIFAYRLIAEGWDPEGPRKPRGKRVGPKPLSKVKALTFLAGFLRTQGFTEQALVAEASLGRHA